MADATPPLMMLAMEEELGGEPGVSEQMTFKVEDEANEGEVHSDPASQSVGVAVNAEQGLLDAVEMEEAGSVRVNGRRRRKHFQGTGISCGNYGKKMAKRSGMVALQCLPLCNEEEFELLTSLEVAKELTRCMHETKFFLVRNCIDHVGLKKTVQLFYETAQIQEAGGILSNDGGMKSPGGVFFALLKKTVSRYQRKKIFEYDEEQKRIRKKERNRWRKVTMETDTANHTGPKFGMGSVFSRLGFLPEAFKQKISTQDLGLPEREGVTKQDTHLKGGDAIKLEQNGSKEVLTGSDQAVSLALTSGQGVSAGKSGEINETGSMPLRPDTSMGKSWQGSGGTLKLGLQQEASVVVLSGAALGENEEVAEEGEVLMEVDCDGSGDVGCAGGGTEGSNSERQTEREKEEEAVQEFEATTDVDFTSFVILD